MPPALRTKQKIKKAINRGEIVYDEYKSGYVRIRYVSKILKRTMLEVTVDNPGREPEREGLAIINCDYGCSYLDSTLCNYIRQREGLTNLGRAVMMQSKNTAPIKLPFWILIVPPIKYKQLNK